MNSGDLVVFSHLRWDGVWQRPHHLVSRLASRHRQTWFVEEPMHADVESPVLRQVDAGPVQRLILEVPRATVPASGSWLTFADGGGADLEEMVADACESSAPKTAWVYSPVALPLARRIAPRLMVYDVMDDLAAFSGASPQLKLAQAQALADADVVFTGGRSLHQQVLDRRRRPLLTYCFPSGVDSAHFRSERVGGPRPVAGYVGVIDERLDLDLVDGLAAALPDWIIRMVGPVTKIDPGSLPQRPNIEYVGRREYAELPAVMAGFDVALMPFALNEATRSISPTKTLEYLAAGLPVVSTRIRDVKVDCGDVVLFADDAEGFAAACGSIRSGEVRCDQAAVDAILSARDWDGIAQKMADILSSRLDASASEEATA